MKTFEIKLSTIEDVKEFVNSVTLCNFEIDLASGRYVVDAKSIMGIFSLDLMKPITMTVHSDECEALLRSVDKFIIK